MSTTTIETDKQGVDFANQYNVKGDYTEKETLEQVKALIKPLINKYDNQLTDCLNHSKSKQGKERLVELQKAMVKTWSSFVCAGFKSPKFIQTYLSGHLRMLEHLINEANERLGYPDLEIPDFSKPSSTKILFGEDQSGKDNPLSISPEPTLIS